MERYSFFIYLIILILHVSSFGIFKFVLELHGRYLFNKHVKLAHGKHVWADVRGSRKHRQ